MPLLPYTLHGYAIVSADDRISDANGIMAALRNPADWRLFQGALNNSVVSILGSLGHIRDKNPAKRNRLVVSSTARGVERRPDAWWWNPAEASVEDALAASAPNGGLVVVAGGRRVFDFFLDIGYAAFFLSRAHRVRIPGGVPIFSLCDEGVPAEQVLGDCGLVAAETETLDAAADASLTVFRPR